MDRTIAYVAVWPVFLVRFKLHFGGDYVLGEPADLTRTLFYFVRFCWWKGKRLKWPSRISGGRMLRLCDTFYLLDVVFLFSMFMSCFWHSTGGQETCGAKNTASPALRIALQVHSSVHLFSAFVELFCMWIGKKNVAALLNIYFWISHVTQAEGEKKLTYFWFCLILPSFLKLISHSLF